jgi:hypothetical protein
MLEVIIGIVSGLAVALVGAIFGAWVWEIKIRPRLAHREFHDLFNFDRRFEVVFVFATGDPAPGRRFPQIAWADARAIEYLLRTLALCDWPMDKVSMQGQERFEQYGDWRKNLVIIGSPKTNTVCKSALSEVQHEPSIRYKFGFKEAKAERDWEIFFGDFSSRSPVFQQEDEGKDMLMDLALLAKVRNPHNRDTKILFVGGIRSYGTWGAAKYLLEHVGDLHGGDADHSAVRDRDFATVVRATYSASDWRIETVERTEQFCFLN